MTAETATGAVAALPVETMARVVGAYVWVEQRLFEIFGALAAEETVPAAALFFDAWSAPHAWHAELLADQLPRLPHLEPDSVIVAPGPAQEETLLALATAPDTAGRLAGVLDVVLPGLVAGYRDHLGRTAPVADANLIRALGLIVHDEEQARADGEALRGQLGISRAPAAGPDVPGGAESGFVPWPSDVTGARQHPV